MASLWVYMVVDWIGYSYAAVLSSLIYGYKTYGYKTSKASIPA